jgi:hypothetical protein
MYNSTVPPMSNIYRLSSGGGSRASLLMETQAARDYPPVFCFEPSAAAISRRSSGSTCIYVRALIVLHAWLMAADNVSDSRKTNKRHRPLDYRVPVSTETTRTLATLVLSFPFLSLYPLNGSLVRLGGPRTSFFSFSVSPSTSFSPSLLRPSRPETPIVFRSSFTTVRYCG